MHSHYRGMLRKDPQHAAHTARSVSLVELGKVLIVIIAQSLLQHSLDRLDHTVIYLLTVSDNNLVTLIQEITEVTA